MTEPELKNEEKKYSVLQWFLFVIIIPLMFAITLSLVILVVTDVNIFESGKGLLSKLPFGSSQSFGTVNQKDRIDYLEQNIADLQALNEESTGKQEALQEKITLKDQTIEQLNSEIRDLRLKLKEQTATKLEAEKSLDEIVTTYENMSPKNAAAILSQLGEEEAVLIISKMPNDAVSAIFEKMDPKIAAKLTTAMAKSNNIMP